MTEDWDAPAPIAGRGRGRVRPVKTAAHVDDDWTPVPGSKPASMTENVNSWNTPAYERKPKASCVANTNGNSSVPMNRNSAAMESNVASDGDWGDLPKASGAGRGMTACISTAKHDGWGSSAVKSIAPGTELPTPSVEAWNSNSTTEQPLSSVPMSGNVAATDESNVASNGDWGDLLKASGSGRGMTACISTDKHNDWGSPAVKSIAPGTELPTPSVGAWNSNSTTEQPRGAGWNLNNGAGRGGGGRQTCYSCNQEGHVSKECPNPGNVGGGVRICNRCGEKGHLSKQCPLGGGGIRNCHNCSEEGHIAKECPTAAPRRCFKCNGDGHTSRDCPTVADGPPRACFKCHSTEHVSKDCNLPVSEYTADGKQREQYTPQEIDDAELFRSGISSGNNFANFDKVALQLTGDDVPQYIKSFEEAGLRSLVLDNIKASGYHKPTPVQKGAIPCILRRRDVMACAVTGSGKTAAYLVPVISTLIEKGVDGGISNRVQKPEVVIIAPTRELATQIFNEARKFSNKSVLKTVIIYGGTVVSQQRQKLQNGCNILVATAGRLKGFIEENILDFSNVQFLILDEADRMLHESFLEEILKVAQHHTMPPPEKRQTSLFSATFPSEIQELAKKIMHNYVFVVTGTIGGTNPDVNQDFFLVSKLTKRDVLEEQLNKIGKAKTIIFVETKKTADFIASFLCNKKLAATSIHGDRMQSQREEALWTFKTNKHNILVATNVAARGLDIPGVEYVINYELPKEVEEYVHRIGRTGRVGNVGRSISFFDPEFDSDKAGKIVEKLVASGADVPPFLQSELAGLSGIGYNFNAPSQQSGFGARDARRFGREAFKVTEEDIKVSEQQEAWD